MGVAANLSREKMSEGFILFFSFCLFSFLLSPSTAVIHGPKLSKRAVRQPLVVKIDDINEPVGDIYQKATKQAKDEEESSSHDRQLRSLPDVAPHGFGTTVVLKNDHHTFALVHWSGLPKKRIFIMTRDRDTQGKSKKSFLWLSKDYGKTFQNITANVSTGPIILEWYYISSDADKLIFADVINNRIYVTTDEGDTFSEHSVDFSPDHFKFQHSYIPNVDNYDTYVLGYDETLQSLWVSTDTGASWTKLGDNVTRYEWRQLNSTYEDGTTVYFDKKLNATASQLYKATQSTYSNPPSFDSSLGVFMPNSFALSYQYMFIQRNYTDTGRPSGGYASPLWVSNYRKPFKAASFSLQLEERHYAMVDGSEGQVLMGVYHDPNNTNLYISEEAGLNYSLSLEHLISPPESDWIDNYPTFDVYVVEGIPGTYLVNRRVYGSSQGATVISFDKGGEWQPVTPPAIDANGNFITCNLPCSLHLHMYVDNYYGFQPILSQDSAPNIIMALGNLGISLNRYNYLALRLYISDNGGVTWRELASGFKEFQLINFGVFTSIVDKWRQTSTVQSSCNEGKNWTTYTFTNSSISQRINVVRMFTEYGEESQHATVFGYKPGVSVATFEWLVIDLDFTVLNIRNCTASDYYQWRPTDEREGQQCILGESITYERRYPDHCCIINYDYERPINRTPCYCALEDFECQVGFERVGLNGQCGPMEGTVYPPNPPMDCFEGNNYSYPSPYRKVAGDKCIHGNQSFYLPISVTCPVLPPADMTIMTSNYHVRANKEITFTLEQRNGGKLVTFYSWTFGDNSTTSSSTPIKGFESAKTQTHSYSAPGTYNVTVFAENSAGNNTGHTKVSILDKMIDFTIEPKIVKIHQKTTFTLESITTLYNTTLYNPGTYTWTFSNNLNPVTVDILAIHHTYTAVGNYSVNVIFSNVYGPITRSFNIIVENATSSLHLKATINGQPLRHDPFAPVGRQILFTVTPQEPDTSYDWELRHASSNLPLSYSIGTVPSHLFTFPGSGSYIVKVTSNNRIGTSTVYGLYTAEYPITRAAVKFSQSVYRVGHSVDAFASVSTSSSNQYNGPVYINVRFNNDTQTNSTLASPQHYTVTNGNTSFSFTVPEAGTLTAFVELYNDVSSVVTQETLTVAGYDSYSYFRVLFKASSLSFDYNDYQSQLAVQNVVFNKIINLYGGSINKWQLDVNVTVETETPIIVNKRSADELYLMAHVTILPVSLSSSDVRAVKVISLTIVSDVNNGTITFSVNNTVLKATADFGPTIFIGPTIVITDPYPVNGKDYKPIVIGLGVGLLLLVIIVMVIVGVIIYYYKKKYRSLEVRYTRLRQGPMRFTFSADGETLEEEDYRDDEEETSGQDEEEEINNDEQTLHNFPPFTS